LVFIAFFHTEPPAKPYLARKRGAVKENQPALAVSYPKT
jgi:hypothetical protein